MTSDDATNPMATLIDSYVRQLDFGIDDFQRIAFESVAAGRGVLVAAPTGAGKTLVGEFAIHCALAEGRKAFYTTPIKALSNQKFTDFCEEFGRDRVGLLTGDTSVNGDADVVVMTTEVLRNMIYAGSKTIDSLGYVIMDEVHYLADRSRGAVWEEVIIHLPKHIKIISLSATISNAEEFGSWLQAVRGDTDIVVTENRPVPLLQHLMIGDQVHDLFRGGHQGRPKVNPDLMNAIHQARYKSDEPSQGFASGGSRHQPRRGRGGRRGYHAQRAARSRGPKAGPAQMITGLEREDLLPAIFFIFSRAGCERAVQQCHNANIRLTTSEESQEIRRLVTARCSDLPASDLRALSYEDWVSSLCRGLAAHHAGMLPAFKDVVEDLFEMGLVKVVFATETLALGVNMPARSVVLDKLVKFNGEAHVDITPGEYTQLTGRAGRRGLDTVGHAVVAHREGLDPQRVGGLASARTYPLKSSFAPTYNMAVNLLDKMGYAAARTVLEKSFAQYQSDRNMGALAERAAEQRVALEGYAKAMTSDTVDFQGYGQLRRDISDLERRAKRMPGRDQEDAHRELRRLRKRLREHPGHDHPDREDKARWSERYHRLNREHKKLLRRIDNQAGSIARTFDRVCEVLVDMGYLTHDAPHEYVITGAGKTLQRIYSERDLVVSECIQLGVWNKLDPAGLSAVISALVFSGRGDDIPNSPTGAPASVHTAWEKMCEVVESIQDAESSRKMPLTPDPDPRGISIMHVWAKGASLEEVLAHADLTAGDFVRLCRQVIDSLEQVRQAAKRSPLPGSDKVATAAGKALDAVDRGVISYGRGGALD